jgi:hypothetical protein
MTAAAGWGDGVPLGPPATGELSAELAPTTVGGGPPGVGGGTGSGAAPLTGVDGALGGAGVPAGSDGPGLDAHELSAKPTPSCPSSSNAERRCNGHLKLFCTRL